MKLRDDTTGQEYFFNRQTGENEWVDGTRAQTDRMGLNPDGSNNSNDKDGGGASDGGGGGDSKKGDESSEDDESKPLPYGGDALLDALVLGQEERARKLLESFGKAKKRVAVRARVDDFGFNVIHTAVVGCFDAGGGGGEVSGSSGRKKTKKGGAGLPLSLLQELLALCPDLLDLPAVNGDTPLHVACKWGRRDASRMLVSLGAQVTAKNEDRDTPLDLATPKLSQRLVKDLNSILSSWKGPLSYPNVAGADDIVEERRKAAAVAAKLEAERQRKEAADAAVGLRQKKIQILRSGHAFALIALVYALTSSTISCAVSHPLRHGNTHRSSFTCLPP